MMKSLVFLSCIILFVGISACNIEKARPSKSQHLFIASDCLSAEDTVLFRSFVNNSGIKIKIQHFSADSLKSRLQEEGVDTEIDVVVLSSTYDMHNFEKSNLLQRMQPDELPINLSARFISNSKKWAGIGIDPYVLITLKDTTGKIRMYKDLTSNHKWCTTLSTNADWYPFYATIVQKMDPKKDYNAYNFIKQLQANNIGVLSEKDSILQCNIFLTSYSSYRSSEVIQKTRFKKGKLIFPNQRIGGSFYNMRSFGIVHQARNYKNALSFFDYLTNESVNKRINNHWKTFPTVINQESPYSYQNIRFKKYYTTPVALTSYFDRVKKILRMLK